MFNWVHDVCECVCVFLPIPLGSIQVCALEMTFTTYYQHTDLNKKYCAEAGLKNLQCVMDVKAASLEGKPRCMYIIMRI